MASDCSTLSGWKKWEKGIVVWGIYDYNLKYRQDHSVQLIDREHSLLLLLSELLFCELLQCFTLQDLGN